MHTKRIKFENASGHKLAALLDLPVTDPPIAYALFAHCFTCSKNYKAVSYVSRKLAAEGLAVFRFDFTGLGESGGDFSETTFFSNVADLVAAAKFMDQSLRAPRILIGHSLGGAAVIQAAASIPSADLVTTIAAPSSLDHLATLLRTQTSALDNGIDADIEIGGRIFKIQPEFLDSLSATNMGRAISDLDRGLLIFHSPNDTVVGIENAVEIYRVAQQPKSFVALDQADHLLTDPRDSGYVGELIAAWARRYIGGAKIN